MFAVCRSVLGAAPEADDAAQATFLVLASKESSLVNQPSVAGWLHRVAWNLSTRAARDARLRQQSEQEAADMMALADSGHEIPRDQLHEALATLPDKFRQALVLRHIEGLFREGNGQVGRLRQQLRRLAGGLMPRVVLEKLATVQMLDVIVPTTDDRELLLVRRTKPSRDVALLLERLGRHLPAQSPP